MKLTDEEYQKLKEAREKRDWKDLDSWKLRYLYQRFIALPVRDMTAVMGIADLAREQLGKDPRKRVRTGEDIQEEPQKKVEEEEEAIYNAMGEKLPF